EVRLQHFHQYRYGHPGFVADAGYSTVTWIEVGTVKSIVGKRIVSFVIGSDPVAVVAVGSRSSMSLDPGMLIRWYPLLGYLSTDPVGFLGHDYVQTIAAKCESSGASAHTPTDDDGICSILSVVGNIRSGSGSAREW